MQEKNTERSQPYHLNIYLFLSVLMLCDYDYLALETRAEKICREILSVYYFKIQPYFCSVQSFSHYLLLKLTLLRTLEMKNIFDVSYQNIFQKSRPWQKHS